MVCVVLGRDKTDTRVVDKIEFSVSDGLSIGSGEYSSSRVGLDRVSI